MRLEEIIHLNFGVLVVDGMRIGGSGGDFEIGATIDANLSALRDPISTSPTFPVPRSRGS